MLLPLAAISLITAACGSDDEASPATEPAVTEPADSEPASTEASEGPATSPAAIVAEDQTSDGTTVTVASITLPAPGFIAVHGDGDGAPGAVIGHSDLLPAGESTNVVVTLDEALTESGLVFPMAHIDIDDDGVYEFTPPDDTTDSPATTADGDVAVVPAQITVG
jgi:hypothetical protein